MTRFTVTDLGSTMRFSLLLYLFVSASALGQQYNFDQFNVEDGLAQSQVYALAQDSQGFIWTGTQGGGVCRFDGEVFQTLSTENGLTDNYVSALFFSESKILWIATTRGLSYFNGREVENVDFFESTSINDIQGNSRQKLWIASAQGLFSLDSNDPQSAVVSEGIDEEVFAVTLDDDMIYAAGSKGIFQKNLRSGSDWKLIRENRVVNVLEIDHQGHLWIGSFSKGLERWNGKEWDKPLQNLGNPVVLSLLSDNETMWVGTLNSGLIKWEEENLLKIDDQQGLPNNQVRCLLKDSWGSLWIGTSGGGFARYFGPEISHLNRSNGLPDKQVYSIEEDSSGIIWMGCGSRGLIRLDPEDRQIIGDSLIKSVKVKSLYHDRQNRMWVGTQGKGIYLFGRDSTIHLSGDVGLGGAWIKDIIETRKGEIWIATAGGGISVARETKPGKFDFRLLNNYHGLPDNRINVLQEDSLGRIWFGTSSAGLGVVLADETILSFESEVDIIGREVRSICLDPNNKLWIGSATQGLSFIDLDSDTLQINKLTNELQVPSRNIYLICSDEKDQLWVGTNNGLYRYSLALNGLKAPIHLGESEGFKGVETCTNACKVDRNDYLWIGTVDGLNRIMPDRSLQNGRIPKAGLDELSLFYKPLQQTDLAYLLDSWGQPKDTLVLTYDQNHLGFSITGIDPSKPDKIRFQWRLLGYDSTWTPLLRQSYATFSNLNPGNYRFEYRACNNQGNCDEGKAIPFKILRPIWQEKWFQYGVIALLVFVIVLFFLWRLKSLQKSNSNRRRELEMNNRILELEQQALRLQMNPHFIFNTLNSIQGLIAQKDSKSARRQLAAFSGLMRSVLENSREEVIPLSEELTACKRYAELEKNARNLAFELHIDNECLGEPLVPPLILQPFIENAIIHGVLPSNRKGSIRISCKDVSGDVLLSVEDNGVGRDAHAYRQEKHQSLGTRVTGERIINSSEGGSLNVIDLKDTDGKARGTRVELIIFGAALE